MTTPKAERLALELLASSRDTKKVVDLSGYPNTPAVTRFVKHHLNEYPTLCLFDRHYLGLKVARLRHAVSKIIRRNRRRVVQWAKVVRDVVLNDLAKVFVLEYESGERSTVHEYHSAALCKAEAAIYERYPTIAGWSDV